MNSTAAAPFFWAAIVQIITGCALYLAGYMTQRRYDAKKLSPMMAQDLRNGGYIPENTLPAEVVEAELLPDNILDVASRDRDTGSIAAGIPLIALPTLLAFETSLLSRVVIVGGLLVVLLACIFAIRKIPAEFYKKMRFWIFGM